MQDSVKDKSYDMWIGSNRSDTNLSKRARSFCKANVNSRPDFELTDAAICRAENFCQNIGFKNYIFIFYTRRYLTELLNLHVFLKL